MKFSFESIAPARARSRVQELLGLRLFLNDSYLDGAKRSQRAR
jgi:hypothetical protein